MPVSIKRKIKFLNFGWVGNKVIVLTKDKYEKQANKFWNQFYKNNRANFFKDRHWLLKEYEELVDVEVLANFWSHCERKLS